MTSLVLAPGRLEVDGRAQVLLCSSVFPFRLPRDTWEHRLRLVRESGYRMVDLYVHWGFHEPTEGEIDLVSPERDLAAFLDLCAEQEMLVMARPGPYICSETDGGGLPGWLHGDRGGRGPIRLRGTDPEYLAAVDRWFAAVLPVLAAAQTTRGGPVALVQIENELDFLDCPDAPEYMAHLAETARTHGIDVPIIACAGQGDAAGATGEADGVVPPSTSIPMTPRRSSNPRCVTTPRRWRAPSRSWSPRPTACTGPCAGRSWAAPAWSPPTCRPAASTTWYSPRPGTGAIPATS
jgi:hypothetical protein